jgi:hypothetical protein
LAVLSPISLRKEMGRRAAQAKKRRRFAAFLPRLRGVILWRAVGATRARTFNHTQRA